MENDSKNSPGKQLPLIPTPAETRWREFRVRYFPIVVFAATLFAIWRLWGVIPPATGLRGIGEGAVSLLTSPHDGFLERLQVQPHSWVEAGQPLLTVTPFNPEFQLDILQSQLQMSRLAMEPSLADRNVIDYEQLRIDSLRLKQELAMAQVNLDRAEKVLPRHEALLKEQLLSRDIYDQTLRDRDYYQAEVREKTTAIKEIDERLEQLLNMVQSAGQQTNRTTEEVLPGLRDQMTTVRTNWAPITLTAPITGEVTLHRQAREFVTAGEPLLTINAARADRIIAYLKQPMPFQPEVGMPVEVMTRARNPIRFNTEIAQIGARVEIITNAIAFVPVGALVDSGLPLILPVPRDVQIRPGEVVDVIWKKRKVTENAEDRVARHASHE